MSWEDILKEDRSNNKVTIEYTMPDNTKVKLGPFPFDEFDDKFDSIPEEAQIGAAKVFN
jgi:hypothetical protein